MRGYRIRTSRQVLGYSDTVDLHHRTIVVRCSKTNRVYWEGDTVGKNRYGTNPGPAAISGIAKDKTRTEHGGLVA